MCVVSETPLVSVALDRKVQVLVRVLQTCWDRTPTTLLQEIHMIKETKKTITTKHKVEISSQEIKTLVIAYVKEHCPHLKDLDLSESIVFEWMEFDEVKAFITHILTRDMED